MENTWTNYGDVNPFEHGGLWVKRDDDDTMAFHVVHIHPDEDSFGMFYIATGYVSIREQFIDWDEVSKYNGGSGTYAEDAKDAFIYYGAENFGGYRRLETALEVQDYLKERGIELG
jgi:hypothetical protein